MDDDHPELVDGPLGDLAAAVADGRDLDWTAARDRANPADRGVIREFEIIAAVSRAVGADSAPLEESSMASAVAPVTEPSEPSDPLPPFPTRWGPLRIVAEIGRGSFGRVLRAWEPTLHRDVALKLLHTVPAASEQAVVAEARLLAQIRHDNVVTVYGANSFDGAVGFWMEYIEGRTLRELHGDYGPLGAPEALLIAVDVCRALAAVHRAGFVHGDIKAQNVMRQVGGRIVLTDFGAARLIQAGVKTGQRPTITPLYAAPEVLLDAAPSARSDLYSLGVLLYYLVTSQFPVAGGSIDEIRLAHASGRRALLRDARPDLPPSFIRIVDAATAPLPEERPESAGALEALIDRAAGRVSAVSVPGRMANRGAPEAERSIAVLPFVDLSVDQSLAYFCEGLAEEIIHALSRIRDLRVVPRASAFRVEAHARDAQQIGAVLNVKTVLEGSVRAAGHQTRVTARLTDAASGVQLWSECFSRELGDILGVQEDIAGAVCRQLGVCLAPGPTGAELLKATGNRGSEAYTLYLKGRYCWNQRTELALHKSATYFHAVIEKEPEFAPAYVALAETYTTLGLYGVLAPHDIMPRAKAAARHAITMAADSASAHASAACIAAVYDWEWREAAVGYHRAIQVDPDDPGAHHWYAINYLVPLQRFEEALTELRRAAEIDSLSMAIRASFGIRSYFAHDFAQAERELRDCLALDSGSPTARLFLGLTLIEMPRPADAIRELETATQVARSPEMSAALAYAHARAGDAERARRLLAELLALMDERYVSPSLVAQVHAGLGELDVAVEWLARAHDIRAADLAWLAVRPVFDGLRSDPRFNGMVASMRQ
jgi:eukaryotic-like serine/threonine-protein kinase